MRIIVDVNLSESTVEFLNDLGHDAVFAAWLMPRESPDPDIVAKAIEEGRVVVTSDLEYAKIILDSGRGTPSLITMRLPGSSTERVNEALATHLPELETALLRGALATIDEKGCRARPL